MSQQYAVILVYATSHALKAEQVLQQAAIPCKLIPVPRHISSDCGSCIRVLEPDLDRSIKLLDAARVGIDGTHLI